MVELAVRFMLKLVSVLLQLAASLGWPGGLAIRDIASASLPGEARKGTGPLYM